MVTIIAAFGCGGGVPTSNDSLGAGGV